MTQVDKLVGQLMKPTYVLNMARAMENAVPLWQRKSARSRAENARKEIDAIVRAYVKETQPYE